MANFKKAIERILEARHIVAASHVNPDGDSIGSLLSLGLGLKQLGKSVYMVSPDGVPKTYRFLPGARYIRRGLVKKVDLAIAVDCGDRKLLGRAFGIFEKAKAILEIDHHEFRRPFGDVSIIDPSAAAVGELIYQLLKALDVTMTKDIAQNILTSIIVETSSFRLPNVTPFTFQVCSELMGIRPDFNKLVEMVYWNKRKEAALLLGVCLSRCRFMNNYRIVWSIVKRDDIARVNGREEDLDAATDEMRSIKTVKIAVLFREKNKRLIRVALRSKGRINVARLAEAYGGGGHFDVAGCLIPNNRKAMRQLLSQVRSSVV